MKIKFCLDWASGNAAKSFKSPDALSLFQEYTERIGKFGECSFSGMDASKRAQAKLWLCHTAKNAKMLSSEELAKALQNLMNSGARELHIAIGPANGFTAKDIEALKPDLLWSFGPMTLPHELAAVVAAEQVYRAYSIIHHLPYHGGH